jgi:pantoate--beta-alanine ligase
MRIQLLRKIAAVRLKLGTLRKPGVTIGLVPTMGALHAGHGSLLDAARRDCDVVVVSIFVNPIQFNQSSDFDQYPRTLETDLEFCEARGADFVFAPAADEIYPHPLNTFVDVDRLTDGLCGARRPGHFRGVTTVVSKLINIVQPNRAYFGEKDAQQLAVIQRMVRDLDVPVQVVPCPTVREDDGLAMSSRNKHLTPEQREQAPVLYRALQAAAKAAGTGQAGDALDAARAVLAEVPAIEVEYLEVVDAAEMQPVETITAPVRIALAAWAGETRLIDNILMGD